MFIIEEDERRREQQKVRALKLAQFYKEEGLYKDAVRSFELYIFLEGKDKVDYTVYKDLGICYSLAGKNEEAIIKLEKSYEMNQNDNKVVYLLAQMYEQRNDYNNAELYYSKVKPQDDGEKVSVYYSLGDIALRTGNTKKAIENFQKVVELQPMNGHTYYVLGELQYHNGDIVTAEKCFRAAHEKGIKKVGIYDYIGHIYLKKKDFENAKINFLIAAGKEENIAVYYKNYLKCLSIEELRDEEIVLQGLQDYNLSLFRLAILYIHEKKLEKAVEILKELDENEELQGNLKKSVRDELNEIYSIKR